MTARRACTVLFTIGISLAWVGSILWAQTGDNGAAPYPLKKVSPKGFEIYKGLLDWVPVSSNKSVAFSANEDANSHEFSLVSFQLSASGAASSTRTLASGLGRPYDAACVWIEGGASTSGEAAGYGMLFVLCEEYETNPERADATVYVGKFDASGKLIGSLRELLKIEIQDSYFSIERICAIRNGSSIGVVPSFCISDNEGGSSRSQIHFIEVGIQDGGVIGQSVSLPLPQSGNLVEAQGYQPAWNGTSWLIPVSAILYKKSGNSSTITMNEALIYAVSGDPSHKAASRIISKDPTHDFRPYSDMHLTPYPGSTTDVLLFVKHQKPVPEGERKQDYLEYDFALKRLDSKGKPVESLTLAVPALTHSVPYDPDYEPDYPDDYWSEFLQRGATLYISRAHDMPLDATRSRADDICEQQFGLYAIDPVSGTVTLEALSFTKQHDWFVIWPIIRSLSNSRFAVVNNVWLYETPYPRETYFSRFDK